jgi:ATP-binding cassette subfamily B protein
MASEQTTGPREGNRWLYAYLWRQRRIFVPSLLALLTTAGLSLAFPWFLKELIGNPADAMRHGIDPAVVRSQIDRVIGTLLGILAVQAFIGYWRVQGFTRAGEAALNDLRRDLFARLVRLPMAYFQEQRAGSLSNRVAADLAVLRDTLLQTVPQFARQSVILVGGLVFVFLASWKLSLVMLGSVPLVVLAIALFGRKVRQYSKQAQDALADSGVVVEETVQSIADVKAFGNEPFEEHRYSHALDHFLHVTMRGARTRAAFLSFVILVLFGTISGVAWYGARLMSWNQITNKEFVSFILFSVFVGASLGSFPEIVSQFQRTRGATERLRELMNLPPEDSGREPIGELQGGLAFERVTFRYASRPEAVVLRDLSLAVKPGERVALVGPSGGGKSTIVSLILGFHRPEAGRVLFDGRDAAVHSLESLRAQLAIVPQEVLLFGGTIRDNIEYGKPGATAEEVRRAAALANAHEFISALPEGYETLVGPRGVKVSGGQRQRIAIARAILADPRILLLDEATSALDTESERLVHDALEHLMAGRTSLIIAHRLSTVRHADRILVVRGGTIVEQGSHHELMALGGFYRLLVETQLD